MSRLLATLLPTPLAAFGGHELFQTPLMCNNPLQFLHLSVKLGKVLHCLLPHHGHLGLGFFPEIQDIEQSWMSYHSPELYYVTQLAQIWPDIISSSGQADDFPNLLADIVQFLQPTRANAERGLSNGLNKDAKQKKIICGVTSDLVQPFL